MTFEEGSNVNFNLGNLTFNHTAYSASIINHSAATQINHLYNTMTSPRVFSFSASSTQDITIKGSFYTGSGQTSYNYYTGNVILKGDLISNNTAGGGVLWHYGTLIMDGSNQQISLPHADAYINHLVLSQTGNLSLSSNLWIKGNISFESGILVAGSYTLKIGGNWTNPLGSAAFTEGTGRVIFNGSSHQYCYGSETFNILEVNKSSGALRVNNASDEVVCSSYDWTAGAVDVLAGTFTANSLADNGIFGGWYVNPVGTINIKNFGGWVDLNGLLNFNGGGTINVFGGTTASYWPYAANATINMNGGVLDFKNQGIQINNSATYTLSLNITGGTIKTVGGFIVNRSDFTPSGGTVMMYGSVDANLSLATGANLHHLTIDKASSRSEEEGPRSLNLDRLGNPVNQTRANQVFAVTNLTLNGNFLLQTGFFTAPALMEVKGNWTNSAAAAAFIEGTGVVSFAGSGNSTCASDIFYTLRLNKSGTGKLLIPTGAVICTSYDWEAGAMQVSGGNFLANDLFDNNVKGSFILSSGTIDLTQDDSYFVDLDADLNISGGSMYIRGGMANVASEWAYTRAISVTMSGGILDYTNQGILIAASGYALNLSLSGGRIRTTGGVAIPRPSTSLAGVIVELYGGNDVNLSAGTGSGFGKIVVNKSSTRDGLRDRANKASAASNLSVGGDLEIQAGTFSAGSYTVTVIGTVIVNGRLEITNAAGAILANSNVVWGATSTSSLTAGSFQAALDWTVASGAQMQFGSACSASFIGSQASNITFLATNSWFHHLSTAKTGSQVSAIGSGSNLKIYGNLSIPAGKTFRFMEGAAVISGTWTQTGSCTVAGTASVSVATLQLDGVLNLSGGSVTVSSSFTQGGGSLILGGGNLTISAAYAATYYGFSGSVTLNSGTLQITNNGMQINSGASFTFGGGELKIGWSFRANQTSTFVPPQGMVEFIGSRAGTIECSNGNYFNDLKINKSTGTVQMQLGTNVTTNRDYIQQSGILSVNTRVFTVSRDVVINGGRLSMADAADRLIVGRNWVNSAGTAGFVEGLGTVCFYGPMLTNLASEDFNHLEVDKPSSQTNVLLVNSGATVNLAGNLILTSGCLKLESGAILDVNGSLTIQPGGGLWFDSSSGYLLPLLKLAGNLTDLNPSQGIETSLNTLANSHIILDGSLDQTLQFAYPTVQLSHLTLQKAGGSVLTGSNAIITQLLSILSSSWTGTATGQQMTLSGDLAIEAGGALNLPGGQLTMSSWDPAQIKVLGTLNVNSFNLANDGATVVLSLSGNCNLATVPVINVNTGVLDLGAYTLQSGAALNVGADGKLLLSPGARLEMAAGASLNLLAYSEFYALGAAGNHATLTSPGGYYAFNPSNYSMVGAQYCVFEKMNTSGINLPVRTSVDALYSFNYCVFQNGAAGGTLFRKLTTQALVVTGAVFPANTWGGAYNAYHSSASGSVTFVDASGAFAGSAFENDPYGKVHWTSSGIIDPPQNLSVAIVAGQAQLGWNASAGASTYRIYRSADPYSTNWGSPVGTTASTSWTDSSAPAGTRWFYRVTAE